MSWGLILLAGIVVPVGALLIWVGRRGAAGKVDFSLGGHSKEKTNPADWEHAHLIIGNGLVASGYMCLVSAVLLVVGPLIGLSEDQTAGLSMGLFCIACFYIVPVIIRGLGAIEKDA